MPYVIRHDEAAGATPARLGGKAAALAALSDADLAIPAWFVLLPDACDASLDAAARAAAWSVGDGAMAAALADLRPAPAVVATLERALGELCPDGAPVAVRSSAVEEDGAARSWAGQLESFLDVPPERAAERVADVWRSAFGARARAYRRAGGMDAPPAAPAVLVQRMVRADAAGVAFSADPVSGRRGVAVVTAVRGLGDALVAGACEGETYRVDRAGRLVSPPGDGSGTRPAAPPILTDERAREVAELARRCEAHLGRPQDVEWAVEGGRLFLLQSRPITALAGRADPDGAFTLWDNSNIAESYGGVTTPLTFSFARHAYEGVYRQLCRTLGAPEHIIAAHDDTFRHMIGLIHGRVYYNLLNWYRLLALLPGFTVNRRFMEHMMGVKEGLPDEIVAGLAAATWRDRLDDARRLALAIGGLAAGYATLPRRIARFGRRLDDALGTSEPALERMRPDELVAHYRDLERRLLAHWDAPLLNDLFAMIFYGLLRTLATRWCGDPAGTLQNDLLSGGGGMISAEPAARVRELAHLAADDPVLADALCTAPLPAIRRLLPDRPAFRDAYAAYLDRFADRCLEELKLESPTLRDDPLPLLRAVGGLARALPPDGRVAAAADAGRAPRRAAERRAAAALAGRPVRRMLFRWVLADARARVRDRENLRFERTRVFGRVRRIFVELGRRLHALDLLDDARDVFYLEVEDALGFVTGTATTTDLKGLVALRRAEYARHHAAEPPAERFATRGIVDHGHDYRPEADTATPGAFEEPGEDGSGVHRAVGVHRTPLRTDGRETAATGGSLVAATRADAGERRAGAGCCPGVVRGPVRVVRDPRGATLRPGEILVAERTDPGWIMLLPAAAGVIVERGSVLSHSAIVGRELGIPTVVGLRDATRWLADGDWVMLDGGTGVVARLAAPVATAAPAAEVAGHA